MQYVKAILYTLIVMLLVACAGSTSPPVEYYHLVADTKSLVQYDSKIVYMVAPVQIPDILKRQPIVSHGDDRSTLLISDTQLWAGDLREITYETLLNLLRHQLPQAEIISISSSHRKKANYRVVVHIQEYFGQLGNDCVLRLNWQLVDQENKILINRESRLNKKASDASYTAYVNTLNQLLSEFSQIVAKELSTIQ